METVIFIIIGILISLSALGYAFYLYKKILTFDEGDEKVKEISSYIKEGAKAFLKKEPEAHIVILETAHPTKFLDVVETTIGKEITIPNQIKDIMEKPKKSIPIKSYDDLKSFLLKG